MRISFRSNHTGDDIAKDAIERAINVVAALIRR